MSSPRILIADRSPELLAFLRTVSDDHYRVSMAETGAEALALMERETFAIAVVGYLLPDMTGLDLVRRCKEMKHHTCPPSIIMSGDGDGSPRGHSVMS